MENHRKKPFLKVGERIRESRKKRFKYMVDFAKAMNRPYRTIQNWEGGVVCPKHDDILAIADLLKVDAGWLEFGPKPQLPASTRALIQEYFPKEAR